MTKNEILKKLLERLSDATTEQKMEQLIMEVHESLSKSGFSQREIESFDNEFITEAQSNKATLKNAKLAQMVIMKMKARGK